MTLAVEPDVKQKVYLSLSTLVLQKLKKKTVSIEQIKEISR